MLRHMAIGLAVAAGAVPAAFAKDSRGLDYCKSAGAAIEADERQTEQTPGSQTDVVVVAVPVGRVCVGPESVDGEHSYVRRTAAKEGMTIVEVSTTPFVAVLASNEGGGQFIARPDQPAGW